MAAFSMLRWRVTELIIAIRMFCCSKEEDKAEQREKILSRWKQLCNIPGGRQHIRQHVTLLISRLFFFSFLFFLRKNYSTVSLSLVRFNNFNYFIFLCNCTSAQINFISLKAIPPTSSPLPSPLFHCSCSFFRYPLSMSICQQKKRHKHLPKNTR